MGSRRFRRTDTNGWHLLAAATALAATLAAPASLRAEATVSVEQGTFGRWADAESCGMDGRTWKALEGTCYYPIDFDRPPGHIEVARWQPGGSIETAWLIVVEKEYPLQRIDYPDESKIHLSAEDLARHHGEQSQIKPLFRRRGGAARFTLPLGKPLDPLPSGSGFGAHREFNGEPKSRHTGTDYAIGMGTSAKSVADGTVVLTGDHFFGGNSVYVYHGDGMVSMYLHLSEIKVEAGQEVGRGDEIGLVGSTGRSTGPHLHLGVRWKRARVDPALLLGDPGSAPAVAE